MAHSLVVKLSKYKNKYKDRNKYVYERLITALTMAVKEEYTVLRGHKAVGRSETASQRKEELELAR